MEEKKSPTNRQFVSISLFDENTISSLARKVLANETNRDFFFSRGPFFFRASMDAIN